VEKIPKDLTIQLSVFSYALTANNELVLGLVTTLILNPQQKMEVNIPGEQLEGQ